MTIIQNRKGILNSGALLFSFIMSSLLSGGCGTWIGNPSDDDAEQPTASVADLSIQGSDDDIFALNSGDIVIKNAEGQELGTLSLTEAKMALSDINIRAAKDSTESAGNFGGPYVVNLLTNEIYPEPQSISVMSGSYGDIDLQLHKLTSKEASKIGLAGSENIIDNSLYAEGTFTSTSGESKSFLLSYDGSQAVSLSEMNGINHAARIDKDVKNLIIISSRLKRWGKFDTAGKNPNKVDFSQVTESSIDLTGKGSGASTSLRNVMKDLILGSLNFGRDDDGDRQLSKAEGGE